MNTFNTQPRQIRSFGIAALSAASLLILSTSSAFAATEMTKGELKQQHRNPSFSIAAVDETVVLDKPDAEADSELKNFFEQKINHLRHGRHSRRHHDDRHHHDRHHDRHHHGRYRRHRF